MRFKLTLEVDKRAFGDLLPINYQYEQSAVIYRMLSRADEAYASWLHENGFQLPNGKTFKLFSYSRFRIEKYRILRAAERLQILSDTVEWQLSFLPEKSTQKFVEGIFQSQIFEIGDRKSTVRFIVRKVEMLPEPEFSGRMVFSTLSPVCLKFRREDHRTDYLSPNDVRAPFLLFKGVMDRYRLFHGKECPFSLSDCSLNVLDEPKSVLVKLKGGKREETYVRGFMCRMEITAPVELMKILYESAAGSLSSMGFGLLQLEMETPQR